MTAPVPSCPSSRESRLFRRQLVRVQIRPDCSQDLIEFFASLAVASIAIGAEPLMGMGVQDGGTSTHDFSALAPGVARCTEGTHTPLRSRAIWTLGQSALAGRLAGAIDIEDEPTAPLPVPQPSSLLRLLLAQGTSQQIRQKEGAQGFDRLRGQGRQKARERRACGQALAPKECHEGRGKRMHVLVEGFQRPFATDGVPKEDDHEVDDIVVAEAAAGKPHALTDGSQSPLLAQVRRQQGDFLEYVIMPPFVIVWYVGLDIAARRSVVFHLLRSKRFSRACFYPDARLGVCPFSAN